VACVNNCFCRGKFCESESESGRQRLLHNPKQSFKDCPMDAACSAITDDHNPRQRSVNFEFERRDEWVDITRIRINLTLQFPMLDWDPPKQGELQRLHLDEFC
jgi:hypothetical protein